MTLAECNGDRASISTHIRPLLVLLSTIHTRGDSRIFVKQLQTLKAAFPEEEVVLVVADGLGDDLGGSCGRVYDLGRLGGSRARRAWRGSLLAFRWIRRERPTTVHFHDPELIPLGLLLKLIGCRVIYDIHEDMPRQILGKHWLPPMLRYPTAVAVGALEWLGGKVFDALVPATYTIGRRFAPERTVVVRNFPVAAEMCGVDTSTYHARDPGFAYIGGLADIRGVREMVASVDRLRHIPDVRLHLAGPFERPELGEALPRLRGWDMVEFHGVLDRAEVVELLARVRAGLVLLHPLPNYLESLPIKMFEYMSAGIPVIASDFPRWREIVEEAGCGLLVDPMDTAAIAEAMRWVLENPIEAMEMGERGRQAVLEKYHWEGEAAKLVGLYSQLRST